MYVRGAHFPIPETHPLTLTQIHPIHDQNSLMGKLFGEDTMMMGPFSLLSREFSPVLGPVEDTYRSVSAV